MIQAGKVAIQLKSVSKTYYIGNETFPVLKDIDLKILSGEMVALTGSSGSGKSTLLNILGCLDSPSSGDYQLESCSVAGLTELELAVVRNRRIGFVFQNFNLVPRVTAWENVAQPLIYRGVSPVERKRMACDVLAEVGLEHRFTHRPNELSGGQRQRVAIARALIGRPQLLLADEPTGNLDSKTSVEIMDLLMQLNGKGLTQIIVTHEDDIARQCRRRVSLQDGVIVGDRSC
jgi:putative ABC transport system ATP-binding protein